MAYTIPKPYDITSKRWQDQMSMLNPSRGVSGQPVAGQSIVPLTGVQTPLAGPQTNTLKPPAMPTLPDYSAQTNLDLRNISSLMNPSYGDMDEARMKAASTSYAQGLQGGGFANNTLYKMLDSEKLKRMEAGNQMLAPYLNRNTTLQTAAMGQEGENYRAALAGQQAMERLQLSESGQMARLTLSEKAALERQVLQGQQALNNIMAQGGQEMEKLKYASAEELKQLAIRGQQALAQIEAQDRGAMERVNAQTRADLERQVLIGQQALQQGAQVGQFGLARGYQSGMFDLEGRSLSGQYGLAAGNLNPMTQQVLSQRLGGAGTSTINSIYNRYAPTAGYPTQNMPQQQPTRNFQMNMTPEWSQRNTDLYNFEPIFSPNV